MPDFDDPTLISFLRFESPLSQHITMLQAVQELIDSRITELMQENSVRNISQQLDYTIFNHEVMKLSEKFQVQMAMLSVARRLHSAQCQ
ncbi:MAG: hypothetical protein Q9219_000737 [cf. Caloplaca sp. 3 TL-2023]